MKRQSLCRCVLLLTERVAQGRGKDALRSVVEQKDFRVCGIEGETEIQRGRNLSCAALKVRNRYNHNQVLLFIA